GFALLPAAKRDALCALYAFMRHADDISDSDKATEDKSEGLKAWRVALDRALEGEYDGSRILPAFHHAVKQFKIPAAYFHDLMEGAEMEDRKSTRLNSSHVKISYAVFCLKKKKKIKKTIY